MAGDDVNNNQVKQLENSLKEFRETVRNSLQQITQTLATLTTHDNDERHNLGGPRLSRGHRNDHPQIQRIHSRGKILMLKMSSRMDGMKEDVSYKEAQENLIIVNGPKTSQPSIVQ
ncbi:hypothetical protein Tco_1569664 [Tanacetum coccineum]